jgi:hypothetical protein
MICFGSTTCVSVVRNHYAKQSQLAARRLEAGDRRPEAMRQAPRKQSQSVDFGLRIEGWQRIVQNKANSPRPGAMREAAMASCETKPISQPAGQKPRAALRNKASWLGAGWRLETGDRRQCARHRANKANRQHGSKPGNSPGRVASSRPNALPTVSRGEAILALLFRVEGILPSPQGEPSPRFIRRYHPLYVEGVLPWRAGG